MPSNIFQQYEFKEVYLCLHIDKQFTYSITFYYEVILLLNFTTTNNAEINILVNIFINVSHFLWKFAE